MTDAEYVAGVFAASYRRLVGQFYAMFGDLPTAEELVQEAFVRALDHARTFRNVDNPDAWLTKVAINLQRSKWRRSRRYALLRPRLAEPGRGYEPPAEHVDLVRALSGLPVEQREVVVLHHLADLPVEQVAETLRVPIGTVKSRLARGRGVLAGLLDDHEEERHV
ncbi:MAG TPA: SigE family RNA polymerase sigma factor [Nocardioidaceae bacterium]|nr:SigE family RNA polymerase sigma factor [Nocardioidaceae bacterium]